MLALAYAAAHPESAGPSALIGCGTFDQRSRARMTEILAERTSVELKTRLDRLADEVPDRDERLARRFELTRPLYSVDPVEENSLGEDDPGGFDMKAHQETWRDMLRLQDEGIYPAAFASIRCPVMMFHGSQDPHPGRMIHASLLPHIPQLEYHEWERCGHSPWLEKGVRVEFFEALRGWLLSNAGPESQSPLR